MKDYCKRAGGKRGEKKHVGTLEVEKLLLYVTLLRWYVEHDYQTTEQVTKDRRSGDTDKSKTLLAELFKLLGNSGNGKLIKALERQSILIYTRNEKVMNKALQSAYFIDLDLLGQACELESRKRRITINPQFQIGIRMH